jgi:FtsP/CotA-like multicopper oxidase with cupredoxin domain
MRMVRSTWVALSVLAVVASATAAGRAAEEAKYSGTVVAVDQAAGRIVVEGMGPWRVKDGVTQLDRRTVAVTASTEFVKIKRARGPAPSGFTDDYVATPLPAWQVKPGDWVTVTVKPDGKRVTASKIDVSDPSEL